MLGFSSEGVSSYQNGMQFTISSPHACPRPDIRCPREVGSQDGADPGGVSFLCVGLHKIWLGFCFAHGDGVRRMGAFDVNFNRPCRIADTETSTWRRSTDWLSAWLSERGPFAWHSGFCVHESAHAEAKLYNVLMCSLSG